MTTTAVPMHSHPAAPVADALDAVADGGSLRTFCRSLGLSIAERRELWTLLRTTHAAAFQHAREFAADWLADETIEIADGCAGNVEAARLAIEARMARCAALHPAVYGDRQHVEHSGTVELVQVQR